MQESLILGQEIPWRRDKLPTYVFMDFPGGSDSKESACNARDLSIIPGLEDPLRNVCQPTPVFLPGESHGQRSPEDCRGRKESDTTEPACLLFLIFFFFLKDNCFTELCCFLPNLNMNQP